MILVRVLLILDEKVVTHAKTRNLQEKILVPSHAAGLRLDLFLVDHLAGVSRKAIKRALDRGQVFVDGRSVRRANHSLFGGETVLLTVEVAVSEPSPPDCPVLFRDEHLLAIAKPAGLPCHPTVAGRCNALDIVTAMLRKEGRDAPPILLHRLDADTTGVLLFALSTEANRALADQFAQHALQKIYLALVSGRPPATLRVENYLKAGPRGRTVAVTSGGAPARTDFRTLAVGEDFALVEACPETGRTHQIRVHLAGAGHPLLGDRLYGGTEHLELDGQPFLFRRHLLHAWQLDFQHPVTGRMLISAPLPEDFVGPLAVLELPPSLLCLKIGQ